MEINDPDGFSKRMLRSAIQSVRGRAATLNSPTCFGLAGMFKFFVSLVAYCDIIVVLGVLGTDLIIILGSVERVFSGDRDTRHNPVATCESSS